MQATDGDDENNNTSFNSTVSDANWIHKIYIHTQDEMENKINQWRVERVSEEEAERMKKPIERLMKVGKDERDLLQAAGWIRVSSHRVRLYRRHHLPPTHCFSSTDFNENFYLQWHAFV